MDYKDFYTFSEYMKKEDNPLTASMEDYLEMIYRLSMNLGFTRIHELSNALNVQPPSATKMVQRLAELNLLNYEKYGVILLREEGKIIGENLLRRHITIEHFLRLVGVGEEEILKETEMMEHTINPETLGCFDDFIRFIKDNPEVYKMYKKYREAKKQK